MGEIPETMFSAREIPWHKTGVVVDEVQTAKDALILAGLDWQVDLYPVYFNKDSMIDGESYTQQIEVPEQFAVVRDFDLRTFQICGSQFLPVQNWRSFEFFDQLVADGSAKYETAGALGGGAHVWITAKVNRSVLIGGEDAVDFYLLLVNTHDGSMAFSVMVTPIRVKCRNTLNLALEQVIGKWSMRHTESIDGKIAEARTALNMTFDYVDEFEGRMNRLIEEDFRKADFEQMMRAVFPRKGDTDHFSAEQYAMIGVLESSPTISEDIRYTKWGALNAVREYDDWGRDFRESKGTSADEQRLKRIWFGPNVANANKALAYLEAH